MKRDTDSSARGRTGGARRERPPPPLSAGYLADQARRHLQRYRPSVAQLRRVLMRRVDRNLRFHDGDREAAAMWVEDVLADLVDRGVLDDQRFATAWVEDLNRRGVSRAGIRHRLRAKGVDAAVVGRCMEGLATHLAEPELAAACTYVRRRRFGPLRQDPEVRRARRQKDLAAMARAGFSYGVSSRALECEDLDALRALCAQAGGELR